MSKNAMFYIKIFFFYEFIKIANEPSNVLNYPVTIWGQIHWPGEKISLVCTYNTAFSIRGGSRRSHQLLLLHDYHETFHRQPDYFQFEKKKQKRKENTKSSNLEKLFDVHCGSGGQTSRKRKLRRTRHSPSIFFFKQKSKDTK